MSEPQPSYPLEYQTTSPYGNAPTQVKLAGVFNLIMGSINALAALLYLGVCAFMYLWLSGRIPAMGSMAASGPATMPSIAGLKPEWFLSLFYVGYAILNLLSAGGGIAAGIAILRRWPSAFGLAIVAVATQFLASFTCSLLCVLPLGCAIYTLVILCMDQTRRYLRDIPPK